MLHLRLHVRVLKKPSVGVDRAVTSVQKVFTQAGVDVVVASNVVLDLPLLLDVNVSRDCQASGRLTIDQKELFGKVTGISRHEIVIFFIRSTDGPTSGCSQHPTGSPGAVITEDCSRWTLAHEIGHLLGLPHVPSSSNLMFERTVDIKRNPPKLDTTEIAKLLTSDLVLP